MDNIKPGSVARLHIGLDKEYKLKQKFFPDYPEYEVEIIKFYGVKNVTKELSAWENGK